MIVIILGEATRVMVEDDGKILRNIKEWGIMEKLPGYEDVGEFLKFIHNYVLPVYGKKKHTTI